MNDPEQDSQSHNLNQVSLTPWRLWILSHLAIGVLWASRSSQSPGKDAIRKLVGFEKSLLLNYRTCMHIVHYRRKELEEFCKLTARNGAEAWWRLLSDNGPSNMCSSWCILVWYGVLHVPEKCWQCFQDGGGGGEGDAPGVPAGPPKCDTSKRSCVISLCSVQELFCQEL